MQIIKRRINQQDEQIHKIDSISINTKGIVTIACDSKSFLINFTLEELGDELIKFCEAIAKISVKIDGR